MNYFDIQAFNKKRTILNVSVANNEHYNHNQADLSQTLKNQNMKLVSKIKKMNRNALNKTDIKQSTEIVHFNQNQQVMKHDGSKETITQSKANLLFQNAAIKKSSRNPHSLDNSHIKEQMNKQNNNSEQYNNTFENNGGLQQINKVPKLKPKYELPLIQDNQKYKEFRSVQNTEREGMPQTTLRDKVQISPTEKTVIDQIMRALDKKYEILSIKESVLHKKIKKGQYEFDNSNIFPGEAHVVHNKFLLKDKSNELKMYESQRYNSRKVSSNPRGTLIIGGLRGINTDQRNSKTDLKIIGSSNGQPVNNGEPEVSQQQETERFRVTTKRKELNLSLMGHKRGFTQDIIDKYKSDSIAQNNPLVRELLQRRLQEQTYQIFNDKPSFLSSPNHNTLNDSQRVVRFQDDQKKPFVILPYIKNQASIDHDQSNQSSAREITGKIRHGSNVPNKVTKKNSSQTHNNSFSNP